MLKNLVILSLVCGLIFGCNDKSGTKPGTDSHDHSHDGENSHDHGDEDKKGGNDHGEKKDLGKVNLGAFELAVTQFGEVKKGGDFAFEISFSGKAPSAVRGWLGTEDAKGTRKMKGELEGEGEHKHFHMHLEYPENGKADTLWIEVQDEKNKRERTSISLKK